MGKLRRKAYTSKAGRSVKINNKQREEGRKIRQSKKNKENKNKDKKIKNKEKKETEKKKKA